MVASGEAYATLLDANEAATMQDHIHNKHLRIARLIKRPYPYLVFFFTDGENRHKIKDLMKCLDTVSPVFIEMLQRDFIPEIRYTTLEVVDLGHLFTAKPYIGAIMLVIIVFLILVGIFIDQFSQWYERHHGNPGKCTTSRDR